MSEFSVEAEVATAHQRVRLSAGLSRRMLELGSSTLSVEPRLSLIREVTHGVVVDLSMLYEVAASSSGLCLLPVGCTGFKDTNFRRRYRFSLKRFLVQPGVGDSLGWKHFRAFAYPLTAVFHECSRANLERLVECLFNTGLYSINCPPLYTLINTVVPNLRISLSKQRIKQIIEEIVKKERYIPTEFREFRSILASIKFNLFDFIVCVANELVNSKLDGTKMSEAKWQNLISMCSASFSKLKRSCPFCYYFLASGRQTIKLTVNNHDSFWNTLLEESYHPKRPDRFTIFISRHGVSDEKDNRITNDELIREANEACFPKLVAETGLANVLVSRHFELAHKIAYVYTHRSKESRFYNISNGKLVSSKLSVPSVLGHWIEEMIWKFSKFLRVMKMRTHERDISIGADVINMSVEFGDILKEVTDPLLLEAVKDIMTLEGYLNTSRTLPEICVRLYSQFGSIPATRRLSPFDRAWMVMAVALHILPSSPLFIFLKRNLEWRYALSMEPEPGKKVVTVRLKYVDSVEYKQNPMIIELIKLMRGFGVNIPDNGVRKGKRLSLYAFRSHSMRGSGTAHEWVKTLFALNNYFEDLSLG